MPHHPLHLLLPTLLLSLTACAEHTYAPRPGMSSTSLGIDTARCHLFAAQTRPDASFGAAGSPKDVAIASGVALAIGAAVIAEHDASTFDYCMQAHGWLVADGKAPAAIPPSPIAASPGAAVPQPVALTPLAPLSTDPALAFEPPVTDPATAEQTARAERAAEAWLITQNLLNLPQTTREQRGLYTALCDAGDRSSCLMASALSRKLN